MAQLTSGCNRTICRNYFPWTYVSIWRDTRGPSVLRTDKVYSRWVWQLAIWRRSRAWRIWRYQSREPELAAGIPGEPLATQYIICMAAYMV